jgi:hypothetical protein
MVLKSASPLIPVDRSQSYVRMRMISSK